MTYTKEQKTYDFINKALKLTKYNKREAITRQAYTSYKYSSDDSLYDVYTKPSIYKLEAFEDIRLEAFMYKGSGLKVISFNIFMFTCGYLVELHSDTYFIYHTASYIDCVRVAT